MEHDSSMLFFHLAREYLIAAKVIRPGVVTLMEMVGTARNAATDLTHEKAADLLTEQVCSPRNPRVIPALKYACFSACLPVGYLPIRHVVIFRISRHVAMLEIDEKWTYRGAGAARCRRFRRDGGDVLASDAQCAIPAARKHSPFSQSYCCYCV